MDLNRLEGTNLYAEKVELSIILDLNLWGSPDPII